MVYRLLNNAWGKLNKIYRFILTSHLEILGVVVIVIILAPILYLKQEAVFPVHDQLDEIILNYIFPARYFGEKSFEAIMCGAVATEGLKPFAPFFVLLYMFFSPYVAFVMQYTIVIIVAFFGTYFCVKKITGNSVAAFLSAAVFVLLPFRSVYGIQLSGTPFLIWVIMCLLEKNKTWKRKTLLYLSLVFYAAATSLVLVGYAVLFLLFCTLIVDFIKHRSINVTLVIAIAIMGVTYLFLNIDLVNQLFSNGTVSSHRVEFAILGTPFWKSLLAYLLGGVELNESFHKYIYIPAVVAIPFLISNRKKDDSLFISYIFMIALILIIAVLAAFFGSETFCRWKGNHSGMIRSFQFQRFYILLPGLWYVLLGISLAGIMKGIKYEHSIFALLLAGILFLPTLIFVAKNPICILYQNVNQINNSNITGYITWEKLYAEDICQQIAEDIGEDKSTYRVASIGINPVVALYNGFYTIDGYSNNYSLEYKHTFASIIKEELELNSFNAQYFYDWGNRCYLFYHEWGNTSYVGKSNDAIISDYRFNTEEMKKLGCRFVFSAGEIKNSIEHGLNLFGVYETDRSFWRIWVYELCDDE